MEANQEKTRRGQETWAGSGTNSGGGGQGMETWNARKNNGGGLRPDGRAGGGQSVDNSAPPPARPPSRGEIVHQLTINCPSIGPTTLIGTPHTGYRDKNASLTWCYKKQIWLGPRRGPRSMKRCKNMHPLSTTTLMASPRSKAESEGRLQYHTTYRRRGR